MSFPHLPSSTTLRGFPLLLALAGAGLVTACGSDDSSDGDGANPAPDAPDLVVDGDDTGVAVVPRPPGGDPNIDTGELIDPGSEIADPGTAQPTDGPAATCGGTSHSAQPKTLEMYVLFDDSGSWSDEHWQEVKDAVNGFVSSPASDGIGVALSFFGRECSVDQFVTPQVPMDVLPAHRAELQEVLEEKDKNGETVTQPALQGGIDFAHERLASGVNSRIVMLLVTDGEPDASDCNDVPDMPNDIPAVAMTAAAGFDAAVSIPTYVLAVAGGDELTEHLQSIAIAGGTEQAINADPAALAEAFDAIRSRELSVLPCEYNLPPAYELTNNPDLVNLTFAGTPLPRLASEAECAASTEGGWYYDNPTDPSRILVCAATCETFKIAPVDQTVDIALGCPTVRPGMAR